MKKTKLLLSALICCSFGLTACDFSDILLKVGIGEKKVVDDDEKKGSEGGSSNSQDHGGSGSGGSEEVTITLEYLKDLIKPIAASIYHKGVSQVEIVEYDPDLYDEVTYYYNFDNVMFTGIYNVPDWKDDEDVIENYLNPLIEQLPENAVLEDSLSENDATYGYYHLVYSVESLYYVVHAEDYLIFPVYSFDIVPKSNYEEYFSIVMSDEEDDESDYDDYFSNFDF